MSLTLTYPGSTQSNEDATSITFTYSGDTKNLKHFNFINTSSLTNLTEIPFYILSSNLINVSIPARSLPNGEYRIDYMVGYNTQSLNNFLNIVNSRTWKVNKSYIVNNSTAQTVSFTCTGSCLTSTLSVTNVSGQFATGSRLLTFSHTSYLNGVLTISLISPLGNSKITFVFSDGQSLVFNNVVDCFSDTDCSINQKCSASGCYNVVCSSAYEWDKCKVGTYCNTSLSCSASQTIQVTAIVTNNTILFASNENRTIAFSFVIPSELGTLRPTSCKVTISVASVISTSYTGTLSYSGTQATLEFVGILSNVVGAVVRVDMYTGTNVNMYTQLTMINPEFLYIGTITLNMYKNLTNTVLVNAPANCPASTIDKVVCRFGSNTYVLATDKIYTKTIGSDTSSPRPFMFEVSSSCFILVQTQLQH